MVLSIVSCNCDEAAWLFLQVLVPLAPVFLCFVTIFKFYLALILCYFKLVANFPFSILPHYFRPSGMKHQLQFSSLL